MVVLAAVMFVTADRPAAQSSERTRHIDSLSAFDYATRTRAARMLRRAPAADVVPARVTAARGHADQFVRYRALVRAIATLPPDELVQRALVAEVGRGFDFFRSAVIEALGERRAGYAVDALAAVAVLDGPLQDDAVLARAADWRAAEGSGARDVAATLIDRLES